MSVCGQNGQAEDESASEEVVAASVRDIYKQKPASKVVRVLTVLAYLLSVSLAAILLSVYYVCVWKSPVLPPLNDTVATSARQGNLGDYAQTMDKHNFPGGGDSSMNEMVTQPSPADSSTGFTNTSVADYHAANSTLHTTVLPDSTPVNAYNGTFDDIGTFNDTDSIT